MWQRFGRLGLMLIAVALTFANQPANGQKSPLHRVNANMAKMTGNFLDTLSDDLRAKATFVYRITGMKLPIETSKYARLQMTDQCHSRLTAS